MKSVATVTTDRAARYGKQLTSHMGRKIAATWEDPSGTLDFRGDAHVSLTASDTALIMELECGDDLERFEHVVGIHLARFGQKDGLEIRWVRDGGAEGTVQGPLTDEDMARMAEERAARKAAEAAATAEVANTAEAASASETPDTTATA